MIHAFVAPVPAARRWPRIPWLSVAGWAFFALSVAVALVVRRQLPWVPEPYLIAVIASGAVAWRLLRWRSGRPLVRWSGFGASVLALVALCPVPWLKANLDTPPGTAWRLDGWLSVDGETVNPDGAWYWLTAGRPPIVAELVSGWLFGDDEAATDLRAGRTASQPRFSEPAAAAVGLRRAGYDVEWTVYVEFGVPTEPGLPEHAVVTALNGIAVATREDWRAALETLSTANSFTTADGAVHGFDGPALPYQRVDVIELPEDGLEITVGGGLASTPPGKWFRSLAVGRSHGMMVALVTYAHFSGDDLANGRSIAGTGKINPDGSVGSIGGLVAKATAARDVGADVLLFPAQQADELTGFDAGSMRLVPITTLDDAIDALRET